MTEENKMTEEEQYQLVWGSFNSRCCNAPEEMPVVHEFFQWATSDPSITKYVVSKSDKANVKDIFWRMLDYNPSWETELLDMFSTLYNENFIPSWWDGPYGDEDEGVEWIVRVAPVEKSVSG